jgi:hypothetical protein
MWRVGRKSIIATMNKVSVKLVNDSVSETVHRDTAALQPDGKPNFPVLWIIRQTNVA